MIGLKKLTLSLINSEILYCHQAFAIMKIHFGGQCKGLSHVGMLTDLLINYYEVHAITLKGRDTSKELE